jgi:hypothetical protein
MGSAPMHATYEQLEGFTQNSFVNFAKEHKLEVARETVEQHHRDMSGHFW